MKEVNVRIAAIVTMASLVTLAGCAEPQVGEWAEGESVSTAPAVVETAPTVTPEQVILKVKVLEKECYGSAGCNVEYRVIVQSAPFVNPGMCEVTYQISGADDPIIGTLEIEDDGYSTDRTESTGTPRSSSKLKVEVTEVACRL